MKKTLFKFLMTALAVVTLGITLSACDNNNDTDKQYVDIIVKHPVTGEMINNNGYLEFAYDENSLMPEISLKLRDKDAYLSDKDFDNGSLLSHMQLFIKINGTYEVQPSWDNNWPKNIGFYEIMLRFNDEAEEGVNDGKYHKSSIAFALIITQNGGKIELREGEAQSIYIPDNSERGIYFQAPVNGIFTLKTQGSVPVEINAPKGSVTDLDNGVNKQLKVNLAHNEVFEFSVMKKTTSSSAEISVLIEFTPNEIKIGQSKQLTIQPGKREYLLFRAENKATPFEFEVTGQDELSLQFAYNKYHNYMPNSISGNHLFGSRLAEYKGKYYLIVSNNSDSVQNVTVALSNISTVSPKQTVNDEIINTKVYELASDYSCSVNISLESDDSVLMRVYDSEHNLLEWTSNYNEKTLIFSAEAKKKYYLVLENILYKHEAIKLSFDFRPRSLNLGNNEIKKYSDSLLTKFTTGDTRASYRIQSDLAFTVFDSDWKTVAKNTDNEYLLEAESTYYVNISGSTEIFNIDINLICTTETSGVFPASGMVLIKYIPTRTTAYKVNGASQVEWYNPYMGRTNAYLYVGQTYYLKLEGTPGEQYSVNIVRNSNRIQLNVGMNLTEGLYFFDVTEAGNYTLWVNCPDTMNTTLMITDGLGNIVRGELHLKNEFVVINFETGRYYLDLELNNGNKAGISIDKS